MSKTIVVEVEMRKAHRKYSAWWPSKKFYAHDEQNTAHVGDMVRIDETRPLSQAEALAAEEDCAAGQLVGAEDTAAAATRKPLKVVNRGADSRRDGRTADSRD